MRRLPSMFQSVAGADPPPSEEPRQAARERLLLRIAQVYQHAVTVFETFELTAKYTEELLRGVPDALIREREADFSARLRATVDALPQLRDIWIIDADGKPLVSGTVFPM